MEMIYPCEMTAQTVKRDDFKSSPQPYIGGGANIIALSRTRRSGGSTERKRPSAGRTRYAALSRFPTDIRQPFL